MALHSHILRLTSILPLFVLRLYIRVLFHESSIVGWEDGRIEIYIYISRGKEIERGKMKTRKRESEKGMSSAVSEARR